MVGRGEWAQWIGARRGIGKIKTRTLSADGKGCGTRIVLDPVGAPPACVASTCDKGQQYVGRPDGAQRHLFSFAVQFRTTDMGEASACLIGVIIRNLCPSRLTS